MTTRAMTMTLSLPLIRMCDHIILALDKLALKALLSHARVHHDSALDQNLSQITRRAAITQECSHNHHKDSAQALAIARFFERECYESDLEYPYAASYPAECQHDHLMQ